MLNYDLDDIGWVRHADYTPQQAVQEYTEARGRKANNIRPVSGDCAVEFTLVGGNSTYRCEWQADTDWRFCGYRIGRKVESDGAGC